MGVDEYAAIVEREQAAKIARLKDAVTKQNHEIEQTLGKALGYPWYKDDQKNFPGATAENGVCVGEHVAESLAMEAARIIERLTARVAELEQALKALADKVDATSECDHTRLSCEEIGCIGVEVRQARAALRRAGAEEGQW